QLLSSSRMETTKKLFLSFLMFILSVEICLAQHWSYGLQPGGKRDADNLVESFQEIASEMEKIGELQHFECIGPHQRSMLGGLKGALASLIEGEAGRKKI
ncbi:gonadotropin releasing hormone 1, partial [Chelydra serpentina]